MDFIKLKIIILLFSLFSISLFSQENIQARFVVEKGKFIFDKKSYIELQNQLKEISELKKRTDSILRANPKLSVTEIDDRTNEYPKLITTTENTRTKFIKNLDLNNIKFGKNLMSIYINKKGIAKNFKCLNASDKKICNQIKKMFNKNEFRNWTIPQFSSINVAFDFIFSIIIDSNFTKYDLKNKWSLDSNLPKFNN